MMYPTEVTRTLRRSSPWVYAIALLVPCGFIVAGLLVMGSRKGWWKHGSTEES